MHPLITNLGAYIKTVVNVFSSAATSEVDGAAIPIGHENRSAQIALCLGDAAGSPSAVSAVAKVQHSANGSTNWTDYTDLNGVGSVSVTAASAQATRNIVLQGALAYVRLVATPTFTGGSSPSVPLVGLLVIGDSSANR